MNGHNFNADNLVTIQDCGFWSQPTVAGQSNTCVVHGTWFVDLDAAEQEFPGEFVKQPLEVVLYGCGEFPTGVNPALAFAHASLTVRMEKK